MCGHEHPWTIPRLMCEVTSHRGAGDHADRVRDDSDRLPMLTVRVGTCGGRSSSEDDDVLFISIRCELDVFSAARVVGPIDEFVACARYVVIDLANVGFVDATGATFLQSIRNQVAARDGVVWLHDPSPPVRRVFDIAPIEGVLTCTSLRRSHGLDHSSDSRAVGGADPIDRQVLIDAVV